MRHREEIGGARPPDADAMPPGRVEGALVLADLA